MKRKKIFIYTTATILLGGLVFLKAQKLVSKNDIIFTNSQKKIDKILYFNPQIIPDLIEIAEPSYQAFFAEISDRISNTSKNSFIRAEQTLDYDNINPNTIVEYCKNNEANFAVVSKIKYFKVGLGKFVFSSQVVVSMKLYNANGKLISETQYDTYRKNKRLLGSAENFIKIGTKGAMKDILKSIKTNNDYSTI